MRWLNNNIGCIETETVQGEGGIYPVKQQHRMY